MILPALAPFILLLGSTQSFPAPGPGRAAVGGGGSCSGITGTFTDCFTYTENPISNGGKWTAPNNGCNGFSAVRSTGSGAFSAGAGSKQYGCAVLTGFTNSNPSARVTYTTAGTADITGPCIWQDTAGNGYCWLLGDNIFKLTAGVGAPIGSADCPPVSGAAGTDVFEISRNSSNVIRCLDVTQGTHGTDVTDSTFAVNKGGFIVDTSHSQTIPKFGWL